MNAKEVQGYYGSHHTPTIVFYYDGWYVCKGSMNVNHTFDDVENGVDVETLRDDDMFTSHTINSLDDLINAVDN